MVGGQVDRDHDHGVGMAVSDLVFSAAGRQQAVVYTDHEDVDELVRANDLCDRVLKVVDLAGDESLIGSFIDVTDVIRRLCRSLSLMRSL